MIQRDATLTTLDRAQAWGLLSAHEVATVRALLADDAPLADALGQADTLHLHIKVDDVGVVPTQDFDALGARLEREKEGFVKYAFDGGINLIFSSSAFVEGVRDAPRPCLDHLGIDLRRETPEVKAAFDAIPDVATAQQWGHVAQGGPEEAVQCCYVEVAAKHWLYPADGVPIELAYGPLKEQDERGLDLRPPDPAQPAAKKCCG